MPPKKTTIAEPKQWTFDVENVQTHVYRNDEGKFQVIVPFFPRPKTCDTYEDAAGEVVTASHLARRTLDLQAEVGQWIDPAPEPEKS